MPRRTGGANGMTWSCNTSQEASSCLITPPLIAECTFRIWRRQYGQGSAGQGHAYPGMGCARGLHRRRAVRRIGGAGQPCGSHRDGVRPAWLPADGVSQTQVAEAVDGIECGYMPRATVRTCGLMTRSVGYRPRPMGANRAISTHPRDLSQTRPERSRKSQNVSERTDAAAGRCPRMRGTVPGLPTGR